MGGALFGGGEHGDGGDAGKLPHHAGELRCMLLLIAGHGNENGRCRLRAQIREQLFEGFAVGGGVASLTCCVDAVLFGRGEEGDDVMSRGLCRFTPLVSSIVSSLICHLPTPRP